jgi:hypothetical protein
MKKLILSLTFFGSIFFSSGLLAQLPSVAIVASDDDTYEADVLLKLENTGFFEFVDLIDIELSTPTVATLQTYDAVIVYTNLNPSNASLLGDNLATYLEGGGGVVAANFSNLAGGLNIGGAFSGQYQLLESTTNKINGTLLNMTIDDPSHPVMVDVSSFNGGSSSFHTGPSVIQNGGVTVASWSDGEPLVVVAEGIGPAEIRRVDLNFFPPSSDIPLATNFWDATTDGDLIMANALLWVAGYDRPGDQFLTAGSGYISDGSNQYNYINNEFASWLLEQNQILIL